MPASRLTDFDRAVLRSLFFLGHEPGHKERPIVYPKDAKQRPHLAYYGTTRSGKTFAIEYALRQIADARPRKAGFCFVDPHGSGYWRMASYLRQRNITDKVLFWDINDPEYVTTYDPFGFPEQSPSYIASNLTAALLATLGRDQGDPSRAAALKTMTDDGLQALVELDLPFGMSHRLFSPQDQWLKKTVFELLQRDSQLSAIANNNDLSRRSDALGAPFRRIENLFRDPRIKCTFTTAGVNFRQLMDEGWIVLVNAEAKNQAEDTVTLFVRILVKTMLMWAKQRPKADDTRPFFLAIDEASRYLTQDTARILAETAGYGFYLLVGMQSLKQAELESPESYAALSTNVGGEIVMRLLDYDEKMMFTRRFFGDRLDFKKVKHEETSTSSIPRIVERPTSSVTHGMSTDAEGRIVEHRSEVEGSAFGVEYDRETNVRTYFYSTDELERMESNRFSRREPGQAQRFGIARVNEDEPRGIEIPKFPPTMYSQDEMAEWLRVFKATQPFTLPLIEAERRFDALVEEKLDFLAKALEAASYERRQSPIPIEPSLALKPSGEKSPAARPRGKKGQAKTHRAER
jgi:hypothetical protein